MLAIFFVRAVNLVQTEHVNDNFRCIEILFIFGELVRRFLQRSGGSVHSCKSRHYLTPKKETLIRIFGGFSGLSLLFIPFIIPSFAPVLPQVVSRHARNF